MQLQNKVALVTGASRGIGAAIAKSLAAQGAFVHVHFNENYAGAEAVLEEIRSNGGEVAPIQFNIADIEFTQSAVADIEALDILVNNAGFATFGRLGNISPQDFDLNFHLNTRGLFFLTQSVLPVLRDGGRIINISSGITRINAANGSVYSASKAAVEAFTRSWAAELGPRQITVNTVSPGMTETDLLMLVSTPEALEEMKKHTPLGRLGQPDDIADVVTFLCSDAGRWITANNMLANGGAG